MVKPDLIVVWPKHLDYPQFKHFIQSNRDLFEKVIIAFTDIDSYWDFRPGIVLDLPDCLIFQSLSFGDWRDAATKQALLYSEASWVLFMEQDFFISREELIKVFTEGVQYGFKQEERVHPGFLLLQRDRLEHTSKNFAANPPHYDHFGAITGELHNIKFLEKDQYKHLNGLSHNFSLCTRNTPEYLYGVQEFTTYLIDSVKYPCSDKYKNLVNLCLEVINESIR